MIVNKNEFLTCLSGKLPYSKDEVNLLLGIITDVIEDGLKYDGQVRTPIGVFKKVTRKSRRIRDISSGELREIPEREEVVFKPSKSLEV